MRIHLLVVATERFDLDLYRDATSGSVSSLLTVANTIPAVNVDTWLRCTGRAFLTGRHVLILAVVKQDRQLSCCTGSSSQLSKWPEMRRDHFVSIGVQRIVAKYHYDGN